MNYFTKKCIYYIYFYNFCFEAIGQFGNGRLFTGDYKNISPLMNMFVQTFTNNLTAKISSELPVKILS